VNPSRNTTCAPYRVSSAAAMRLQRGRPAFCQVGGASDGPVLLRRSRPHVMDLGGPSPGLTLGSALARLAVKAVPGPGRPWAEP
jgi:hypothetical protein